MTFSPRPEDSDIAAKYQYGRQTGPDIGGQTGHDAGARTLDRERAVRIFELTSGHVKSDTLKILDYGGGNGKIMVPYRDAGHDCYVVDYNENPLPGIKRIGNDLDDMHVDEPFDVIVCNHVLEHVSDVSRLVSSLRANLKADGVLYAEVPLQIWAGLPIETDPVTHINFFTPNSFERLFVRHRFGVLESKRQVSNYADNAIEVLWVLAARGQRDEKTTLGADADSFLYPSRRYSVSKLLKTLIFPTLRRRMRIRRA